MNQPEPWQPPAWLRRLGMASWLFLGLVGVLALVFWAFMTARTITFPLLFAILFGATFFPLVDGLVKWHFPRWLASLLVLVLIVVGLTAILLIVTVGLINNATTIWHNIDDGVQAVRDWFNSLNLDPEVVDQIRTGFQTAGRNTASGIATGVAKGVQSTASLVFGIFVALNILFFMLNNGRQIAGWAARHMGMPEEVARPALRSAVKSLRGYMWGNAIVGAFNAIVLMIGAVVANVPLALTIGVVTFFTAYIPFFGAIISAAFAILIALGAGGYEAALIMLIFVVIANGPLQNVVSQFALGASLKIDPLVVLLATTLGGVVAGVVGATFAAPFTAIALDIADRARQAGMFSEGEAATGPGSPAESRAGPPLDV